ncbi:hypothetical protein KM043_000011, partial [Ampulex compressa]
AGRSGEHVRLGTGIGDAICGLDSSGSVALRRVSANVRIKIALPRVNRLERGSRGCINSGVDNGEGGVVDLLGRSSARLRSLAPRDASIERSIRPPSLAKVGARQSSDEAPSSRGARFR